MESTVLTDQPADDAVLERRASVIGGTAVRMHEHIVSPIGDQITVSRHLNIAGIFSVERHGHHGPSFEGPGLTMCEFDHPAETQFTQQ